MCLCVVRGQVRDWREEDEVVTKHWAYPGLSLVSPGNTGLSLVNTGTCHDVIIMKRKLSSGCLVITPRISPSPGNNIVHSTLHSAPAPLIYLRNLLQPRVMTDARGVKSFAGHLNFMCKFFR